LPCEDLVRAARLGNRLEESRISDVRFLVAAADAIQTIYTECDAAVASPFTSWPTPQTRRR